MLTATMPEQYLDYGVLGLTVAALITYSIFATTKWNDAVNERVKATEMRVQDALQRVQDAKDFAAGSSELKSAAQAMTTAVEANTKIIEGMRREWK